MYKEASKQKLRIDSPRGGLAVEQLWDLSLAELDALAVALQEEHKASGKKSFLVKTSKKDKTLKLKFDIVVDILTTKVEDDEKSLNALENKAHNQNILALIAEKKNEELQGKSIEELEGLMK